MKTFEEIAYNLHHFLRARGLNPRDYRITIDGVTQGAEYRLEYELQRDFYNCSGSTSVFHSPGRKVFTAYGLDFEIGRPGYSDRERSLLAEIDYWRGCQRVGRAPVYVHVPVLVEPPAPKKPAVKTTVPAGTSAKIGGVDVKNRGPKAVTVKLET